LETWKLPGIFRLLLFFLLISPRSVSTRCGQSNLVDLKECPFTEVVIHSICVHKSKYRRLHYTDHFRIPWSLQLTRPVEYNQGLSYQLIALKGRSNSIKLSINEILKFVGYLRLRSS